MIGPSDNTATNAWIERLGVERSTRGWTSLGFPHIRLLATHPGVLAPRRGPLALEGACAWATSRRDEVAEWMARVARGELLDAESSRRIFEYLDKDPSRLRIARRFRPRTSGRARRGTMRGVRNDSGILRTKKGRFVLVVLTDGARPTVGLGPDHPAVLAIADAGQGDRGRLEPGPAGHRRRRPE